MISANLLLLTPRFARRFNSAFLIPIPPSNSARPACYYGMMRRRHSITSSSTDFRLYTLNRTPFPTIKTAETKRSESPTALARLHCRTRTPTPTPETRSPASLLLEMKNDGAKPSAKVIPPSHAPNAVFNPSSTPSPSLRPPLWTLLLLLLRRWRTTIETESRFAENKKITEQSHSNPPGGVKNAGLVFWNGGRNG